MTSFRLRDGVDYSEFASLDGRLQTEVAYQQPGILRRTTAHNPEGEWIVVAVWQDGDSYERALAAVRTDPTTSDWWNAVVPESFLHKSFHTLDE